MKMRKIIAIAAAVLMLCSILPISAMAAETTITFTLGADGSASHSDGNNQAVTSYSETVDGYTLSLTGGANIYKGARDAKGNGCLKLGASSKAGSFTLTVPDDVIKVTIGIGKYKTNTTKVKVNSTTYTISGASNSGTYDAIEVDTSSNKTITLATQSGGYRAMVNYISFVVKADESGCEHEWKLISTTPATCTEDGEEYYECANGCDETDTKAIPALGHSYGDAVETVAPDCVTAGEQESTCSVCGDVKTETVKALGHTWVDGFCDVCGDEKPLNATIDFSTKDQRTEYSNSVQKWENDGLTLTNNKSGSTTAVGDYANPARFYKSSQIIISYEGMTSLEIDVSNAGDNANWDATLAGLTFTKANGVYTITFAEPTDSITLTCAAQVRAKSITAYGSAKHKHSYADEFDAVCDCGEVRVTDYEAVTSCGGTSVSEDVSGLAFKFDIVADVAIAFERISEVDYANSYIGEFKLIGMGAVASNNGGATILDNLGDQVIDIPARWLFNLEDGVASFAVRITEIPENHYDTVITARPYYVYENAEGDQFTIYGEEQASSYNSNL